MVVVGLLIGAGMFATFGPEPNPLRALIGGSQADPASALVESAEQLFELDSPESLAAAGHAFDQALELRPKDATIKADRALVLSTQADALRRWASELDANALAAEKRQKDYEQATEKFRALPAGELVRAPEKPAAVDIAGLRKDAESKRGEASVVMKQAFELARAAFMAAQTELAPSRALADYYRVQRDPRTTQLLGQAKAAASARGIGDAATIYIEAAAEVLDPEETSPVKLEQASRLLDEALTLRPSLLRARVLLARILLARKLPVLARHELERVIRTSPNHAEAKRLLAKTGAPAPTAAPNPASEGTASGTAAAPNRTTAPSGASGASGAPANAAGGETPAPNKIDKPADKAEKADKPTDKPDKSTDKADKSTDKADKSADKHPSAAPKPAADDKKADVSAQIKEGDHLREQGKPWKALLIYEKAADKRPNAARAYTGMGWCYLDLGKPVAALTQFRKASSIDERFGEAVFGRAEAQRALAHKDEALEAYRQYLQLEPGGPDANAAKRAISSLEKGE
jgi:tetratricopeptide (TPR) repeat protein